MSAFRVGFAPITWNNEDLQSELGPPVAYGTVLHERRKTLHERTAQAMEALYRANLDEHYSDLAHHYTRSGNTATPDTTWSSWSTSTTPC